MITAQSNRWFFEATTPVEGHMNALIRTIAEVRTKFQHAEIIETAAYGKCLVLDGRLQSSQADEFVYHEAIVHPGLLTIDAPPRSVLIVGGGEGATLREVLRYPSIERAVMVDIDAEVVDLCRRHLPEMHRGAFNDPRALVLHENARSYLESARDRFDFICLDLVEPFEKGPACLLFTREFYALVRDRLTPGGIVTMQAGWTKVIDTGFFCALYRTLRAVFPVAAGYQTFMSCFGMPWGFIAASNGADPERRDPATIDRRIAERVRGELGYWDGLTHRHAFSLPKFLRDGIAADSRIITDAEPFVVA